MNSTATPTLSDDENPEWTNKMFMQARPMINADPELVILSKQARGRPKIKDSKILLSIRYDPKVISFFKATGKGWQTRMNNVLQDYIASHS